MDLGSDPTNYDLVLYWIIDPSLSFVERSNEIIYPELIFLLCIASPETLAAFCKFVSRIWTCEHSSRHHNSELHASSSHDNALIPGFIGCVLSGPLYHQII